MYSTRQDRDGKLEVFKRRREVSRQEPLTDGENPSQPARHAKRSAKLRAMEAIAAGDGSDSSSDSDGDDREPSISLRQSVNPEDIENIRKQNSGILRSIGDILEKCENPVVDWDNPIKGPVQSPYAVDQEELKSRRADLDRETRAKFPIPPILYLSDLLIRIQPFFRLVEDLFENQIESYYKHEAASASKASSNAFLSLEEFRSMDINRFLAGYYGLKRQLSVGQEILRLYKPFLLKRQGETMRWWGVTDFANYVLAPEVLASFCIIEMDLGDDIYDRETREKAYDIFNSTTEFGLLIADTEPLERWEVTPEVENLNQSQVQFAVPVDDLIL